MAQATVFKELFTNNRRWFAETSSRGWLSGNATTLPFPADDLSRRGADSCFKAMPVFRGVQSHDAFGVVAVKLHAKDDGAADAGVSRPSTISASLSR